METSDAEEIMETEAIIAPKKLEAEKIDNITPTESMAIIAPKNVEKEKMDHITPTEKNRYSKMIHTKRVITDGGGCATKVYKMDKSLKRLVEVASYKTSDQPDDVIQQALIFKKSDRIFRNSGSDLNRVHSDAGIRNSGSDMNRVQNNDSSATKVYKINDSLVGTEVLEPVIQQVTVAQKKDRAEKIDQITMEEKSHYNLKRVHSDDGCATKVYKFDDQVQHLVGTSEVLDPVTIAQKKDKAEKMDQITMEKNSDSKLKRVHSDDGSATKVYEMDAQGKGLVEVGTYEILDQTSDVVQQDGVQVRTEASGVGPGKLTDTVEVEGPGILTVDSTEETGSLDMSCTNEAGTFVTQEFECVITAHPKEAREDNAIEAQEQEDIGLEANPLAKVDLVPKGAVKTIADNNTPIEIETVTPAGSDSSTVVHKAMVNNSLVKSSSGIFIKMAPKTGIIHTCAVCKKSFSIKNNLLAHMKTCTGYKVENVEKSVEVDDKSAQEENPKNVEEDNAIEAQEDNGLKTNPLAKVDLVPKSTAKTIADTDEQIPIEIGKMVTPAGSDSTVVLQCLVGKTGIIYTCRVCRKSFSKKNNLLAHMKSCEGDRVENGEKCVDIDDETESDDLNSEKPLSCDYCTTKFKMNDSLRKHIKRFHTQKSHVCHICAKSFSTGDALSRHLKFVHLNIKPHVCTCCEKGFPRSNDLLHHRRNPQTCEICGEEFCQRGYLVKHVRKVHDGKKYETCEYCGKELPDVGSLNRHIRSIHAGLKPHGCERCSERFTDVHSLDRHVRLEHSDREVHRCVTCGKPFQRAEYLFNHVKEVHGTDGERFHKCEKCEKSFLQRRSLLRHLQVDHNVEKPHGCDTCGDVFKSHRELRAHIRSTHNGLKPHICEKCGISYLHRNSLLVHLKSFCTGEKSHVCDLCQASFDHRGHLVSHVQTVHNGESEIKCRVCSKILTNRQGLKKHLKKIHNLEIDKKDAISNSDEKNLDSDETNFHCETCSETFRTDRELTDHAKVVHNVARPHKCLRCDNSYASARYLDVHIKDVHAPGADKYVCTTCGKSFKFDTKLAKHLKTVHKIERAHQCGQCDKNYAVRKYLVEHIKDVHGPRENDLVCETCGKTFLYLGFLQNHIKRCHEKAPVNKEDQDEMQLSDGNEGLVSEGDLVRDLALERIVQDIAEKIVHDRAREDLVPDTTNERLVPESTNQRLVHESTNQRLVPDSANQRLVPNSTNQRLVHESTNQRLVPNATNQRLFLDSTNQRQVHEPTNQRLVHKPNNQRLVHEPANQRLVHESANQRLVPDSTNQRLVHEPANQRLVHDSTNQRLFHCSTDQRLDSVAMDQNHCCNTCGSSFFQREDLLKHVRMSHGSKISFCCNVCGKLFIEQDRLLEHVNTVHVGE